jgi:hypothetical protein
LKEKRKLKFNQQNKDKPSSNSPSKKMLRKTSQVFLNKKCCTLCIVQCRALNCFNSKKILKER